jgi:PIN domain nuclease of toxin-antitoxin system
MAIKSSLGKLRLDEPIHSFLTRELATNNFDLLNLNFNHIAAIEVMPLHHRDPFDRMLTAQSQVESMPVVSCDAIFDQYSVQRIW